jgi:hypothetical protein
MFAGFIFALLRLSTMFWCGWCNHCILARFLWCKNHEHSSSNRGSFASIRTDRDPLADVSIFCLMFSQALFMSSLSLNFSKAANLCEILTWYYFLTSSSVSYLRLNLSTSNFSFACLLTIDLSLTLESTRQWSVSQSAPLKDRTSQILECLLVSLNMWLL